MARRYDAFVLHSWQHRGEHRVEVQHLQSGARIRNATLTAAADWIGALGGAPHDRTAPRSTLMTEERAASEVSPPN